MRSNIERLKPLLLMALIMTSSYMIYSTFPYVLGQSTEPEDDDISDAEACGMCVSCCDAPIALFLAPIFGSVIILIILIIGMILFTGLIVYSIVRVAKKAWYKDEKINDRREKWD